MYHAMCLFSTILLLVLIAPTHRGMARLSIPVWLVLNGPKWSRVQAPTGLDGVATLIETNTINPPTVK